jgi:hypothetical protein
MNFPCNLKVTCSADSPVSGFSSETPDQLLFFPRLPYVNPNNGITYSPPPGTFYPPCANTDQATADACAATGN